MDSKIKEVISDDQIIEIVYKSDPTQKISWENRFIHCSDKMNECNNTFVEIEFFYQYWQNEKKYITAENLQKKYIQILEHEKNNYSGDLFYYPGKFFNNETGEWWYFDNHSTKKYFLKMISENILEIRTPDLRPYCLTLKKIFSLLANQDNPPLKIIPDLLHFYYQLYAIKENGLHEIQDKIKEKERNRKNTLSITPFRINKIKRHSRYSELEKMVKEFKDTPKETRDINQLIKDIVMTKSMTTVRRYRELIFRELK